LRSECFPHGFEALGKSLHNPVGQAIVVAPAQSETDFQKHQSLAQDHIHWMANSTQLTPQHSRLRMQREYRTASYLTFDTLPKRRSQEKSLIPNLHIAANR
jgi:hypothetical protein